MTNESIKISMFILASIYSGKILKWIDIIFKTMLILQLAYAN